MSQKQGFSMVQLAGRMSLKREAARRWVNSFEKFSQQSLQDSETENYVVPQEVVEVLVAAKGLLESGQVDSRAAALEAAMAEPESASQITPEPVSVEQISERLDKNETLLLAIIKRLDEQETSMSENMLAQFRLLISETLSGQKQVTRQAAEAAATAGVNKAVSKFEAKLMQRVNTVDKDYEQAVAKAVQNVAEASTEFQDAAQQIRSDTNSVVIALDVASTRWRTFLDRMGSIVAAIEKASFWRLAPLALSIIFGLVAGTAISMSVVNAGWEWTVIVTGGSLALALFVYWMVAVIYYRFF